MPSVVLKVNQGYIVLIGLEQSTYLQVIVVSSAQNQELVFRDGLVRIFDLLRNMSKSVELFIADSEDIVAFQNSAISSLDFPPVFELLVLIRSLCSVELDPINCFDWQSDDGIDPTTVLKQSLDALHHVLSLEELIVVRLVRDLTVDCTIRVRVHSHVLSDPMPQVLDVVRVNVTLLVDPFIVIDESGRVVALFPISEIVRHVSVACRP